MMEFETTEFSLSLKCFFTPVLIYKSDNGKDKMTSEIVYQVHTQADLCIQIKMFTCKMIAFLARLTFGALLVIMTYSPFESNVIC